jgi:hypothetical protein
MRGLMILFIGLQQQGKKITKGRVIPHSLRANRFSLVHADKRQAMQFKKAT